MYLDTCNCTFTTSGGENVGVSISALMKIITELPEVPKLFSLNIKLFRNSILPENFIILSDTVANALEEAIRNKDET